MQAARICLGPEAALRLGRRFDDGDAGADAALRDAGLLFMAGQHQAALDRLDRVPAPDAPTADWFRLRIDALLLLGQAERALPVCRDWRRHWPGPHGWPAATLRILYDLGRLRDTSIRRPVTQAAAGGPAPIPRHIVQFWNDDAVPTDVQACMASWSRNNPAFAYTR